LFQLQEILTNAIDDLMDDDDDDDDDDNLRTINSTCHSSAVNNVRNILLMLECSHIVPDHIPQLQF
jgi:hypothetical protein